MSRMDKPDPRLQIRKLPFRILRELSQLLDIEGDKDWKALAAALPDGMFSGPQIKRLEGVSKASKSPSTELLTELGYQLLTVKQLIGYLTIINHQEALLLLKQNEAVKITRQPTSVSEHEGGSIRLRCNAKGFPLPTYQWIKLDEGELDTGIDKELILENVTPEDSGKYVCRVANDVNAVNSDIATVRIIPKEVEPRREPERWIGNCGFDGLVLNDTRNDALKPMDVFPGQHFVLSCGVDSLPGLAYYWMKNGQEMPGENGCRLIFDPFKPEDVGFYSCRVVGPEGHMLTKLMQLRVGDLSCTDRQFASGKVALIIGNQAYRNKKSSQMDLVHPADDAKALAAVLREMGYRVLCMVDLDFDEMTKAIKGFCDLLSVSPNMYGLFYFGGHGYEENGKTFLVPVDAPTNWDSENCVCADQVLSLMQRSKTKFNMMVLDVCRLPSGNDSEQKAGKSFDAEFIPGSQCVIAYATCPQSQAFERRTDANGIYMKHLLQHIRSDLRVEQVLFNVHKDVSKDSSRNVITKIMSPTINSSAIDSFSLCDPVVSDLEKDPTEQWFKHHRLPASRILEFENDIKVQLSFESVCSNICNLVLHVVDVGRSFECDVKLLEISKPLQIEERYMNYKTPIMLDAVPRSNPDSAQQPRRALLYELRTTLPNLQKLTGNVAVTLEAAYVNMDNKEQKTNKCLIINMSEFGITSLFK
ncbi:mucosa-associated lymphoid tissue lymphoma translocation protein 1-like isoform X2 [Rhopilema esculentum]